MLEEGGGGQFVVTLRERDDIRIGLSDEISEGRCHGPGNIKQGLRNS